MSLELSFWSAFSLAKGHSVSDLSHARYYLELARNAALQEDEALREGRISLIDNFLAKLRAQDHNSDFTPLIERSGSLVDVDSLAQEVKEGVSLVTCCKNRNENLAKALPSWLALDEISEIVIVDWDSDCPVRDTLKLKGFNDDRIKVVKVQGQPRWILSHAFNLGFRLASYNRILKVDADIVIDPEFFNKNQLRGQAYVTGDWRIAEKGQEYINGFFYAWRSDLLAIKGFNEYITTYGWDDDDIYGRLEAYGLERLRVDPKTIHHLPHDDSLRINDLSENAGRTAFAEIRKETSFSIFKNKILCSALPAWNEGKKFIPFGVVTESTGYLEVVQTGEYPHYVSDSVLKCAEYLALNLLSSWKFGPDVYKLPDYRLANFLNSGTVAQLAGSDILKASATDKYSPPMLNLPKQKLYIDAQHGLGNRLRAIASAAAIAEKTNRELVVVWEPDHHCECRLSDIFDYDGSVIEQSFLADARRECDIFNYMEIEEGALKDQEILSSRSIYARSAYVLNSAHTDWESENKFLRSLVPSPSVSALVEPFDLRNTIGAHIRMEAGKGLDHNTYDSIDNWTQEGHDAIHYWRDKSHYSAFIKRIDQLMEQSPGSKLFLAADMKETYQSLQGYYGDTLRFLDRPVFDRSAEQIQYALADVILLSRCQRLLGSTWSSFSELAARLSKTHKSVEMSGTDF